MRRQLRVQQRCALVAVTTACGVDGRGYTGPYRHSAQRDLRTTATCARKRGEQLWPTKTGGGKRGCDEDEHRCLYQQDRSVGSVPGRLGRANPEIAQPAPVSKPAMLLRVGRVAALTAVIAGVLALSAFGHEDSSGREALPAPGSSTFELLDCKPDDLIFEVISTFIDPASAANDPGGSPDAREAVRSFLARDYPQLSPSAFEEAERSSSPTPAAQFVYKDNGATTGIIIAEASAGKWRVPEFVGCDDLLKQGTESR